MPESLVYDRLEVGDKQLNSPLWNIAHLVWTDYQIGMTPLGYKGMMPVWAESVGFGSTGELPDSLPGLSEVMEAFDQTHQEKLDFIRGLDDAVLNADYAIPALGFRNNYYALLHLARHEGVHCGTIGAFCALQGIRTV